MTVLIKEFGWGYRNVPQDMKSQLQRLYELEPERPPSTIWYLGPGYGEIHNQVNAQMFDVVEWIRSNKFEVEDYVINPPMSGGGPPSPTPPTPTPPAPSPEPPITPSQSELKNKSFEEGWSDIYVDIPGISLINQQPTGWTISYTLPGETLPGSSDKADVVPEMVHKHKDQLPQEERPGGARALILDGNFVYKVFSAWGAFSAKIAQRVTNLEPDSEFEIDVPVQIHAHNTRDPWGAEIGVRVNNKIVWLNFGDAGDRTWNTVSLKSNADADGIAEVEIVVKSKYGSFDFFIDNIQCKSVEKAMDTTRPKYKVVYNLLPQNASEREYMHVVQNTYESKQTIGFSADDAGNLVATGAEGSIVVAWNPERIGTGLSQSWFDRNYPGAKMITKYLPKY